MTEAIINLSLGSPAALLEASTDLLRRVFELLPLPEKLRFSAVSRRWRGLLLESLCFDAANVWRAPRLVTCSGLLIRRLDVSCLKNCASPGTLCDLILALAGGAGQHLCSLVMWDDAFFDRAVAVKELRGVSLHPDLATVLRRVCPNLDSTSRLALIAEGAQHGLDLLSFFPGRSVVTLLEPRASQVLPPNGDCSPAAFAAARDAERASFAPLLRHSRLAGIIFVHIDSRFQFSGILEVEPTLCSENAPLTEQRWFRDALYAEVVASLQSGESTVEHLLIEEPNGSSDDREQAPFASAGDVAEAVAGFSPPPPGGVAPCVRSFGTRGESIPVAVRRTVLAAMMAAAAGAATRQEPGSTTTIGGRSSDSIILADTYGTLSQLAPHGTGISEAFAELLDRLAPALKLLIPWRCSNDILPALAPLLSSPTCSLRRLTLWAGVPACWVRGYDLADKDHVAEFAHALQANRSLQELSLVGVIGGYNENADHRAILGALSRREVPLRTLDVMEWRFWDQGAQRAGSALGLRFLAHFPLAAVPLLSLFRSRSLHQCGYYRPCAHDDDI